MFDQHTIQLVAITRADGALSVMQFITEARNSKRPEEGIFYREATDEAIAAEIAKTGIKAASWRRVDIADLPADRGYRDAWVDDGKAVSIHPEKAAAINAARAEAGRDFRGEFDALKDALVAKAIVTKADVTVGPVASPLLG